MRQKTIQGFLLISTLTVVTVLILIVSFYLHAIIKQTQFHAIVNIVPRARAHAYSALEYTAYVLAHDAATRTNFTENESWSATLSALNNDDATTASIAISNTHAADATMTITSTATFKSTTGTRTLLARIFAPAGTVTRPETLIFANSAINGLGSTVSLFGGEVYTNGDISLDLDSVWTSDEAVYARETIATSTNSLFNSPSVNDNTTTTTPEWVEMVSMDFDATNQSFYDTAQTVYTEETFSAMLASSPVILSGITYVTGNAIIPQGTNITINGILVASGSIEIAHNGTSTSATTLTINHTPGSASGLASKRTIIFGPNDITATIDGVIYAGNKIHFSERYGIRQSISITGALIADTITMRPRQSTLQLTYNNATVADSIRTAAFHPLVIGDITEIKN